jgi:hypothetical protein
MEPFYYMKNTLYSMSVLMTVQFDYGIRLPNKSYDTNKSLLQMVTSSYTNQLIAGSFNRYSSTRIHPGDFTNDEYW